MRGRAKGNQIWRSLTRPPGGDKARIGQRARWRESLGSILESNAVHFVILVLLLIDLVATAVDILHTLHNDSHDLSVCIAAVESCTCIASFEVSESWEFLFWISFSILCILALNIAGLLLSFGFDFFRHPGYILDAVVVVTALCFEIFLDTETAGLLVILNLWRIIRVAHGVFEVTDEAWEKQINELEGRIQAVEAAHNDDLKVINRLQLQIADLQGRLDESFPHGETQ
ncbi:hypothetical protein KP509_31G050900 [Ceratopteris richardii]|nr:hypothetical protein KP509_31G050900 [Ceratopteris richardii]